MLIKRRSTDAVRKTLITSGRSADRGQQTRRHLHVVAKEIALVSFGDGPEILARLVTLTAVVRERETAVRFGFERRAAD